MDISDINDFINRNEVDVNFIFENINESLSDNNTREEYRYIIMKFSDTGLYLELTPNGIEEANENGIDEIIFYDFMEDITTNSDILYHNDAGHVGLGLTEAPAITKGYYIDDDGTLTDGGHNDSRLFYYSDYMISDFTKKLNDGESVFFNEVLSNTNENAPTDKDVENEDNGSDSSDEKDSSNSPDSKVTENIKIDMNSDEWEIKELNGVYYKFGLYLDNVLVKGLVSNSEKDVLDAKKYVLDTLNKDTDSPIDENIHTNMKHLFKLMKLKDNVNELFHKFGVTDIDKIKESLDTELDVSDTNIVFEDVYKELNIIIDNDDYNESDSLNESLRNDLGKKLL